MAYSGVFDDIAGWFDKDKGNGGYVDDGDDDRPLNNSDSNVLSFPYTLNYPTQKDKKNYLSSYANNVQSISGIDSEAAILVKVDGNVAIAAKNADTRVHPASMSKLMTLIVACESIPDKNTLLTVTQDMYDYMSKEGGSGVNLQVGDQISVEDALYLISYQSDTIACLLIAEHISGSEDAFTKLMNDKAKEIGLTGTYFSNTTGLYDDETDPNAASNYTYTTCRDMAAIMLCAMNNPAVKSLITTTSNNIKIYGNDKFVSSLPISSTWYSDRFQRNKDNMTYITPTLKVMAGKTGYEDIPRACFVTVAGNPTTKEPLYICVTVGRINRSSTVTESQSTDDTIYIYKNYIS